jgi:DNA-binding PadR family transcriptional regulator
MSGITPPLFYILLSLAERERHGYEILKEVQSGSLGKIRLGPATLYTSLKRLRDARLVQEVTGPREGDPRRRYYRLTRGGRAVLADELERMERAVKLGRHRAARATT